MDLRREVPEKVRKARQREGSSVRAGSEGGKKTGRGLEGGRASPFSEGMGLREGRMRMMRQVNRKL